MEILFSLLAFGAAAYCLVQINSLIDALKKQQIKIEHLERKLATTTKTESVPIKEKPVSESVQPAPITKSIEKPVVQDSKSDFGSWVQENFLMKLGAVFVLLAVIWLLSYLYVNELVPLELLTVVGVLAGLAVAYLGERKITKNSVVGQVLLVSGITISIISIVTATNIFGILSLSAAFAILLALVGVLLLRAYIHDAKFMAITGLAGLYLLPALIISPEPDYFFLANYGIIICIFSFVLAALKKWNPLLTITIVGTAVYSLAFENLGDSKLIYILIFVSMFFVGTIIRSILNSNKVEPLSIVNSVLGNMLTLVWVFGYVPKGFQTIMLATLACLSLVTTFIYRFMQRDKVMVISQFFFMATYIFAITLKEIPENQYLSIILAIELLGMSLLSRVGLKHNPVIPKITTVLQVLPAYMAVLSYGEASYIYNILGMAVILSTNAFIFHKERAGTPFRFALAGGLIAWHILVWELMKDLVGNSDIANSISLILFTIPPLFVLYYLRTKNEYWKLLSIISLFFILGRLLLVEVWLLSTIMRVVAFMGIGLLFVLTAFINKGSKKQAK